MTILSKIGITASCMLGAAGGDLIQNHTMDLQTVCAVGAVVLAGTWSLSRRFAKLDDRIEVLEKMITELPCEEKAKARSEECNGDSDL